MSETDGLRGKWLLIGHYGAGNTGDEAMCRALIASSPPELRARLVLVAKTGTGDRGTAGRLTLRPGALARALFRVDGVILGGGTHFHDEYVGRTYVEHLGSMSRHVLVYALTRLLGGRVIWVGVGVGPLRRAPARLLFRAAAGTCSLITVRDRASFERCRALLSERRLRVVRPAFDLAALLPAPSPREGRSSGEIVLGVSVMNLAGFRGFGPEAAAAASENLAAGLGRALAERDSLHIRIFIIGQSRREDDREASSRLRRSLERAAPGRVGLVEHDPDPERTLGRFADCDAVLATRYHSLLFGYLAGCRLAALAYNEKVADLCEELGLGPRAVIRPEDAVDREAVDATLHGLLAGDEAFAPTLPLEEARVSARRNIELLIAAVEGRGPAAEDRGEAVEGRSGPAAGER